MSIEVEIKHGPAGREGGVAFPEVQAEIDKMSRVGPLARPWVLKRLPRKWLVKKMREFMGFPNRDIAGDRVATRHDTIVCADRKISVRIYTPQRENRPILIYYHGGGWIGGSVDTVENIGRGIADRADCVVVNVDYRLAPEHRFPAGLEDCYAAIEWARDHASEIGGDSERIIVAGDSAGGNLATVCCWLADQRDGPRIAAQVLVYPGVDLSGRYEAEFGAQQDPDSKMDLSEFIGPMYVGDDPKILEDPRVSPWLFDDVSSMPPAFVITAEYCTLRDQGEGYARKLAAAGVDTKAVRYNGVNHAFLDKVGVWKHADACIDDIAAYLNDVIS